MKSIHLIIFAFILSINAAYAALPGALPSITVSAPGVNSGSVSISPAQLSGTGTNGIFSLYSLAGTTNGNFFPLYKNGTAYQVTAGKTAYCFDISSASGGGSQNWQLMSATASFAANASTVTGGVFQGGATQSYVMQSGPTSNLPGVNPGVYSFSASTFPGVQPGAASTFFYVHMDCYEQ